MSQKRKQALPTIRVRRGKGGGSGTGEPPLVGSEAIAEATSINPGLTLLHHQHSPHAEIGGGRYLEIWGKIALPD